MNNEAQTPIPMSFAILRNTHEVFRSSISLMSDMLERGELHKFRQEWGNYQRCRRTHLSMEDGAVFPLLDEIGSGAISEAGLAQEHVVDLQNAERVGNASTSEETAQAFETWKKHQLEHLAHEEKVMGPLTMKTSATPEGRGQVVHDTLLLPALEHGDFDWYLAFTIERLTAFGTTNQPPNVAVRVYAWGLQHAATPAEWSEWKEIVRSNTSEEIWDEMVTQFQIDGDGKIKD
jgi:hypothetical protein